MVVAVELGAQGEDMGQVNPELGFGEKEELFAFEAGGSFVAMVSVFGPDGEVAGEFQFVVEEAPVPVLGEDGVGGGFGIGDISIVEDGGEPGVFPMPGNFGAGLVGIRNIITVLFGFGDAGAAAVLQLEEDLGSPGAERLAHLDIELADIIAGAKEVGFCFQQEVAGFDEYARISL